MRDQRGQRARPVKPKPLVLGALVLLASITTIVGVGNVIPRAAGNPPAADRVNVLVYSWANKTPFLTSLMLNHSYNDRLDMYGPLETPYYNVRVITPDTFTARKHLLTTWDYDVIVMDSFMPLGYQNIWDIMAMVNGSVAHKSLLFFGGSYPELELEEFSEILPVDIVLHRLTLNSTLSEIFEDTTGQLEAGFDEYLNYSFNTISEYNNKSDQIEVEIATASEGSVFDSPGIAWGSCPLLKDRIQTYGAKPGAQIVIQRPSTKEPVIVKWTVSSPASGRAGDQVMYISTGTLNPKDTDEWNKPFYLWPYFNYFMYVTLYHLKVDYEDDAIESYADWPFSPIPHEREAALWMIFVASLWVFNFVLFFWLGRKKRDRGLTLTQQTVECPKCGKENPVTGQFCLECGEKLPVQEVPFQEEKSPEERKPGSEGSKEKNSKHEAPVEETSGEELAEEKEAKDPSAAGDEETDATPEDDSKAPEPTGTAEDSKSD